MGIPVSPTSLLRRKEILFPKISKLIGNKRKGVMSSFPMEYKYNKCLQEEEKTNISKFTILEYFHSLEEISLLLWMWADGSRFKTVECEKQMDLGKWRHSVACQSPLLRKSNLRGSQYSRNRCFSGTLLLFWWSSGC